MPAVSIITPAWNAADYVEATIDSVRSQTFTDWEMIVIDDGSSDATPAIVARHAALDSRIRLARQANAGVAAARNHGMRLARGQYFVLLDSDDIWLPEFLAAQIEVFDRHPDTGLVTGNGFYFGGPFDGRPARPVTAGTPVVPLTEIVSNERAVFVMTTFRRSVADGIGGFDEALRTNEDYDYWIRAVGAGFVLRRNPRPLARYRVRAGSLSDDRVRMMRGMLVVFRKAHGRSLEGTPERLAIDAQIARFETELLLEEGKAALERGEFTTAAARLRACRARGGSRSAAATAWLAEHAPPLAMLAFRARRWRPAWLRDRPPAPPPHLDEAAV